MSEVYVVVFGDLTPKKPQQTVALEMLKDGIISGRKGNTER